MSTICALSVIPSAGLDCSGSTKRERLLDHGFRRPLAEFEDQLLLIDYLASRWAMDSVRADGSERQ
jgi:hypothetical protein